MSAEERGRLDVDAEAVRPHRHRVGHHVLEDAGLEIPAGGVEPGRVRTERVEHLLHLVDGRAATRRAGWPGSPRPSRTGRRARLAVEEVAIAARPPPRSPAWAGRSRCPGRARPARARRRTGSARCRGCAADTGAPSTVTSGSSRCRPRSRCMKNGSSPVGDAVLAAALGVGEGAARAAPRRGDCGRAHGVDQPVAARSPRRRRDRPRRAPLGTGVERVDEHAGDRARARRSRCRAAAGRRARSAPATRRASPRPVVAPREARGRAARDRDARRERHGARAPAVRARPRAPPDTRGTPG